MNLRIIHQTDRPADVDPRTSARIVGAIAPNPSLLQSQGADKTILSVHAYLNPVDQQDERWAIVLQDASGEVVVADAPAKRHVFKAYRDLVELGERTHRPTRTTPHAWDYCDVSGVPANVKGAA